MSYSLSSRDFKEALPCKNSVKVRKCCISSANGPAHVRKLIKEGLKIDRLKLNTLLF